MEHYSFVNDHAAGTVIRQRIHGPLHTGGVAEALLFIVVLAVDALLVVRLL
jgi:hypothetical protein